MPFIDDRSPTNCVAPKVTLNIVETTNSKSVFQNRTNVTPSCNLKQVAGGETIPSFKKHGVSRKRKSS